MKRDLVFIKTGTIMISVLSDIGTTLLLKNGAILNQQNKDEPKCEL